MFRLFKIDTKPSNFPPTGHVHAWYITGNINRLFYLYFLAPRSRHQGVLHSRHHPGGVDDQEEHRCRPRSCHQVREPGVEVVVEQEKHRGRHRICHQVGEPGVGRG